MLIKRNWKSFCLSNGETQQNNIILKYIYFYVNDIMQYPSLSSEKTLNLRRFSVLAARMVKGAVLRMGRYTRAIILMAKWGNSSE